MVLSPHCPFVTHCMQIFRAALLGSVDNSKQCSFRSIFRLFLSRKHSNISTIIPFQPLQYTKNRPKIEHHLTEGNACGTIVNRPLSSTNLSVEERPRRTQ